MSKSEYCSVRISVRPDPLFFASRVWHNEADVAAIAFKNGAKVNHFVPHMLIRLFTCALIFYVCGSRTMAAGVKEKLT